MRSAGILLFLLFALLLTYRAPMAERRRYAEAEGIYLLLLHLGRSVERGVPLAEAYASFRHEALEGTPFLAALRTSGLKSALVNAPARLPEEILSALTLFAEGLGTRYLEEEREALSEAEERVRTYLTRYREELPQRIRLKRALTLTACCMLLILLI